MAFRNSPANLTAEYHGARCLRDGWVVNRGEKVAKKSVEVAGRQPKQNLQRLKSEMEDRRVVTRNRVKISARQESDRMQSDCRCIYSSAVIASAVCWRRSSASDGILIAFIHRLAAVSSIRFVRQAVLRLLFPLLF